MSTERIAVNAPLLTTPKNILTTRISPDSTPHLINQKLSLKAVVADVFYHLVSWNWGVFGLVVLSFMLLLALIFWSLLLPIRHHFVPIPARKEDLFFFSLQLLTGMDGPYNPLGIWANLIVVIQGFFSLLLTALLTGIIYARFSRPTARIIFTKNVLVSAFNGVPSVVFRVANERASHIMEAQARVFLLRNEILADGTPLARLYPLELQREVTPSFSVFPWTVVHAITEKSPLYGMKPEDFLQKNCRITVLISGVDNMLANVVHAHHVYRVHDIIFNGKFHDMMHDDKAGRRVVDFELFDSIDCRAVDTLIVPEN